MIHFFGALIVGSATGYVAERLNFTRNGYIVSVALGLGGAVGFWFIQRILGIGPGFGLALTSVIGAAALLFLASMRR